MTALVVLCVQPGQPFAVHCDALPEFDLALFDFTGNGHIPTINAPVTHTWSVKTHGKGEILSIVANALPKEYDFIAILDDDISLRVSDINYALFLGHLHQLDIFQPCLSHDSPMSYAHIKQRPGWRIAPTTLVEVMMPFFSRRAFEACRTFFHESLSGWGLDIIWSDLMQKRGWKLAILHAVMAVHLRPINSRNWKMPNGKTPNDELIQMMKAHGLNQYEIK